MNAVPALRPAITPATSANAGTASAWDAATDAQRRVAQLRMQLIGPGARLVGRGASVNHVAQLLIARLHGAKTPHQQQLATQLGDVPSVPTLKRWLAAYRDHGKAGLLPRHTGRVRRDYGWEARAVELYNLPGKTTPAAVAWKLRREGHESATESRVARYVKSLPATLGANSPARVGRHLHRLRFQRYQPRSTEGLLVGEIYTGDGHTIDCYLAHPNTGRAWRPEFTAWLDVRSRRCVGWWLSESESGVSTLFALSAAMRMHDHVPAWVYIDQGAGYRSRMLNDDVTGFYQRFGMGVIGALPGNPHGKGWIERFFRTVRDHHDKFFADGRVYCGDDMAPEINRRLSVEINSGRRSLPPLADYCASLTAFIDAYNAEPMATLGDASPADVWAQLQRVPIELPAEAIVRPQEVRKVVREMVQLHGRQYYADAFADYTGQELVVEYDLHDDRRIWTRDLQGRFIAEARLVNKISVLPQSRIEEGRDRRERAQQQRLQRKSDEVAARRRDAITPDDQIRAIEAVDAAGVSTGTANWPRNAPLQSGTSSARTEDPQIIDIDILDYKR